MKGTKHGLVIFPPKKTLIWRRHCLIDQSCCSMTSKRFLESSSGMKFFQPSDLLTNQRCVCIRSINQSNRFISARLLFLFCSRVFISRSYENRSNDQKIVFMWKTSHFPSFSKTSLKGNSVMGYFFISPLLCNRKVAPGHNMVCVFFSFSFCLPVVPCGLLRCYSGHNRPFRSSLGPVFQNEGKCSAFDMKIIFHSHANKTHFHEKGCAPSLILKVRGFGTRKWPIVLSVDIGNQFLCWHFVLLSRKLLHWNIHTLISLLHWLSSIFYLKKCCWRRKFFLNLDHVRDDGVIIASRLVVSRSKILHFTLLQ